MYDKFSVDMILSKGAELLIKNYQTGFTPTLSLRIAIKPLTDIYIIYRRGPPAFIDWERNSLSLIGSIL
jgi:hypothetical protein